MNIPTPYLVFLGDAQDYKQAKTAFGISEWRPNLCVGQMQLPGCKVHLGIPELTPKEAVERGAKTFLIGISPFTRELPESYAEAVLKAIDCKMDIANPLHGELPLSIRAAAFEAGVTIHNFRHRSIDYPKGTGEKRSGLRLLTVGTDCACGKKFTALSISKALDFHGVPNTFRSTGQTGFLISQSGINNDTIQADFLSGAAEWLTPENDPWHIDIVEGQGALSHPSFGAGSLSLLYGTQPDYIIMCHEPGRTTHRGVKMALPNLKDEIHLVEMMARRTNKNAKVIAISLFTREANLRQIAECTEIATELDLPCFDPINPFVIPGAGLLVTIEKLKAVSEALRKQHTPNMDKHGARYV